MRYGAPVSLWHITSREAWAAAQLAGEYQAESLESQGFIHLSEDRQWLATANRFYRGQGGMVLLRLRDERLRAPLKLQPADNDVFPHLYGALNLDAVDAAFELVLNADGTLSLGEPLTP